MLNYVALVHATAQMICAFVIEQVHIASFLNMRSFILRNIKMLLIKGKVPQVNIDAFITNFESNFNTQPTHLHGQLIITNTCTLFIFVVLNAHL